MSCERKERLDELVLGALSPQDAEALAAHVTDCAECREELAALRATVDAFDGWPTDVLRPSGSLWARLSERVGQEVAPVPAAAAGERWVEPEWDEVAPGISVKILALDSERNMVSMLVHLAPGTDYPPHVHAGVEELHLLEGELWIDDRKLYPGDYNRALPGTSDARVWSETGCTCVLVTSTRDVLR